MDTAKIFSNGRSQAVRLPLKYRFQGPEVYIRRDAETGGVILSQKPTGWADFFALRDRSDPDIRTFLSDRTDPLPERDME